MEILDYFIYKLTIIEVCQRFLLETEVCFGLIQAAFERPERSAAIMLSGLGRLQLAGVSLLWARLQKVKTSLCSGSHVVSSFLVSFKEGFLDYLSVPSD